MSPTHPHPQPRGCHRQLWPMGVCSGAQIAQAPWRSQAGCVYSLNSVWELQGAALGGCNCAGPYASHHRPRVETTCGKWEDIANIPYVGC